MANSKRARSWKRRTQPRIDLTNAEPVLYSTFYLTSEQTAEGDAREYSRGKAFDVVAAALTRRTGAASRPFSGRHFGGFLKQQVKT